MINEEYGPDHDGMDSDSLALLLHRNESWTHDIGIVNPGVATIRENLKEELTCAQLTVPTAVEMLWGLRYETLASCGDVQKRLTAAEAMVARGVQKCEMSEAELYDVKLKLNHMEDWKKTGLDADEKDVAAISQLVE